MKFFVLALEQLGATTQYSCEGHPHGFYIDFRAPYRVARKIVKAGYFNILMRPEVGRWLLQIATTVRDEGDRGQLLSQAASAWVQTLGVDPTRFVLDPEPFQADPAPVRSPVEHLVAEPELLRRPGRAEADADEWRQLLESLDPDAPPFEPEPRSLVVRIADEIAQEEPVNLNLPRRRRSRPTPRHSRSDQPQPSSESEEAHRTPDSAD